MTSKKFSSFKNIPEWHTAYSIMEKYAEPLSILSSMFSKKYNFKENDIADAFLYEIMDLTYSSSKMNNFLFPNHIKSFSIYALLIFAFILCLPIFMIYSIFAKERVVNVLYEEMWDVRSWYKRFYKYVDDELNVNISRALFLTSFSIFKQETDASKISSWNGDIIDVRDRNKFFCYKTIYNVIVKDSMSIFFLYNLSKKNGVDFIYLYLRLLRRFIMYSSHVSNIKAMVILSAGDYYWNPIRYICYKRKIDNIILIQHNNKDNYLYGRLFPYCDYYYGHSEDSLSKLEGIDFTKKASVGSFQLIPFLEKREPIIDILFINNTVNDMLEKGTPLINKSHLLKQHEILISNFKSFLEKYDTLNVVYVCKPTYLSIAPAKNIQKEFENFQNFQILEAYGPEMFELVSTSKLIINMYSGVGKEAYGLDKKVLWINYDACCNAFEIDTEKEDIHIIIKDTSYKEFERKVTLLLSENKEVDEHYKKLKEKYMNMQGNPAKILAGKIHEILGV